MTEYIEGFINPLQLLQIDSPWASLSKRDPIAQDILEFLCTPGVPSDVASLAARYQEISQEPVRLSVVPRDQRILEKLVWPLRHAKASYIVGNFLSTIALSGTVAEMLALFLFELSVVERVELKDGKGAVISAEAFEKLGQSERVRTLAKNGRIDDPLKRQLDRIRAIRKKYLHFWSKDHDELPKDSLLIFQDTVAATVKAFGFGIANGAITLKPSVLEYLKRGRQVAP